MRDRLNALVLAGTKTATAGLWKDEYEPHEEAVDVVGERQVVLDSNDEATAMVEITRVETHRFADVPWEFALAEGEGFRDIEHWRDGIAPSMRKTASTSKTTTSWCASGSRSSAKSCLRRSQLAVCLALN